MSVGLDSIRPEPGGQSWSVRKSSPGVVGWWGWAAAELDPVKGLDKVWVGCLATGEPVAPAGRLAIGGPTGVQIRGRVLAALPGGLYRLRFRCGTEAVVPLAAADLEKPARQAGVVAA